MQPEQAPRPHRVAGGHDAKRGHSQELPRISGQKIPFRDGSENMHHGNQSKNRARGNEARFHSFIAGGEIEVSSSQATGFPSKSVSMPQ